MESQPPPKRVRHVQQHCPSTHRHSRFIWIGKANASNLKLCTLIPNSERCLSVFICCSCLHFSPSIHCSATSCFIAWSFVKLFILIVTFILCFVVLSLTRTWLFTCQNLFHSLTQWAYFDRTINGWNCNLLIFLRDIKLGDWMTISYLTCSTIGPTRPHFVATWIVLSCLSLLLSSCCFTGTPPYSDLN